MPTLPKTTRMRPLVRVLYRLPPGSDLSGNGSPGIGGWSAWQSLVMSQRFGRTSATNGFLVDMWSRQCLPLIGEARLRYRTGCINGINYIGTDVLGNPIPVNLKNAEIRIQVAPSPAFEMGRDELSTFVPVWKTAWWGVVEQIETMGTSGETIYHCFDGFYKTKRWQMIQHAFYMDGDKRVGAGNPGYNFNTAGFYARIQGNLDPSGATVDPLGDLAGSDITNRYYCHTRPALNSPGGPGSEAIKWTEKQIVEHAMQSSRTFGETVFEMRGATVLFSGQSSWPVAEGTRCWDFVARVCDRRRGRGLVFVDWEDDTSDPLGNLDVCLRVRTPFHDDLNFTPPGSSPVNIPGAATAGSSVDLDYSGDHRLIPGSVTLGDPVQYAMDYVESRGERIEAMVSLSTGDGSLEKRWSQADEDAFVALTDPRQKATSRWDPVFQRYGLPSGWSWIAKDGNKQQLARCDYFCDVTGQLLIPGINVTRDPPSLLTVSMLSELPIYEGWNYQTSTPARWDAAFDLNAPPRRRMGVYERAATGDSYIDLSHLGFSLSLDPEFGIMITYGPYQDERVSGRWFSKPTVFGYAQSSDNLIITVTLLLADRVRMATGNPLQKRRLIIYHEGLHLWIAHPGAIWDLDRHTAGITSAPAFRNAASTSANAPGVLRDDRAALAQLHNLALAWYMTAHRTMSYSLRDCIALPSFTDIDDAVYTNPTIGSLVQTFTFTDATRTTQIATLNTPITGYVYDNVKCRSDISTGWCDLDFVSR